jgi:hypothetical protein
MRFIKILKTKWKQAGWYERCVTVFMIFFYIMVMWMMFGCGVEDNEKIYPEDTRVLTKLEVTKCGTFEGHIFIDRPNQIYTIDCDNRLAFPADVDPITYL